MLSVFLQRPCVLASLTPPVTNPASVLTFWFGCDSSTQESRSTLNDPATTSGLQPIWFTTNPEFDQACGNFTPLIKANLAGELTQPEWLTLEGKFARLLLADQLARNVFRGKAEAFQSDGVGLPLARELVSFQGEGGEGLVGVFPAPWLMFVGLPLMHSESLADHDTLLTFLHKCKKKYPTFTPFDYQVGSEKEHRGVLERFGRYPHRNAVLGRENTAEETEWLGLEERPGWSK